VTARSQNNTPQRKRELTRRRFLEMLGLGSGAVLVARCAPTPQATPIPGTPSVPGVSPTAAQPTPTTAAVAEPQVLIYSSFVEVSTIDPLDQQDMAIDLLHRALYDSLWWETGFPPELEPRLCADYEVSDDVREWILHLDDRAVFHDGTPVTSAAVAWTLKSLLRLQTPRAAALLPYMDENSVEIVDDYTVRLVLTTGHADIHRLLALHPIVNNEEALRHETGGDLGRTWLIDHEAGSGPFTIKRWDPGTAYEVEAVPEYWWGWPPEGRLAGAIYTITRDAAERRMALMAGEVDAIDTLAPDDLALINDNAGTHTEVYPSNLGVYIMMNNQREPFTDVNFRKFMAYAFDYEGFAATQGGPELAPLMTGCIPDGVPGHDPNVQPVYRQDLAKAREYLDKTAWAGGGLEFNFVYVTEVAWEEALGTMLAEPLAEFGFTVNLAPTPWPDMVAMCAHPDTGADLIAIVSDCTTVATSWFRYQFYSPTWDSEQGGGFPSASFYKNADLDALLEEAEGTADEDARMKLVRDMQQMIMEDAPSIMVHMLPNIYGLSDRVKGMDYNGHISADWYPLRLEEA
jgi:peptide/nickel transport system substrate-binding protein